MNAKIPDEEAATPNGVNWPAPAKTKKTIHRRYRPERIVRQTPRAFWVRFRRNGQAERTKRYWAFDAGQAFAKCHREFPSAEIIEAYWRSEYPGQKAITVYQAPSFARIAHEPRPKEKQELFGFINELGISLSPHKAGIATAGLCS